MIILYYIDDIYFQPESKQMGTVKCFIDLHDGNGVDTLDN